MSGEEGDQWCGRCRRGQAVNFVHRRENRKRKKKKEKLETRK